MRRFETRALLAGGYRGKSGSALTHTVEVASDGALIQVLCGRPKLDHVADEFASNPDAAPTCERCYSRDPRPICSYRV